MPDVIKHRQGGAGRNENRRPERKCLKDPGMKKKKKDRYRMKPLEDSLILNAFNTLPDLKQAYKECASRKRALKG